MSNKIFLFTRAELLQVNNKETRKIGLSGKTWEEALRFMCKKPFGNFVSKTDNEGNIIGYVVSWLEKHEQGSVVEQLPKNVAIQFQNITFDEDFIDIFIQESRRIFRETIE
jgi:hypothetical protein